MKKLVILAVAVLTVGIGAFSGKALADSKSNVNPCCGDNAACCPSECCK